MIRMAQGEERTIGAGVEGRARPELRPDCGCAADDAVPAPSPQARANLDLLYGGTGRESTPAPWGAPA